MNCPNCEEELLVDGEFEDSSVELDTTTEVVGTITCNLYCIKCTENLMEHELDIEQDITDFTAEHDDERYHELEAKIAGERFTVHTSTDGTKFVGASATLSVHCTCGRIAEYEWSDYEALSEVLEMI